MGNKQSEEGAKNRNIKVFYREELLYQQSTDNTRQFVQFLKNLVLGRTTFKRVFIN
jgi:hypothetical protein